MVRPSEYASELALIKQELGSELQSYPEDVVGDFRLLRFFLDAELKVDATVDRVRRFLRWRQSNRVEDIRREAETAEFEDLVNFSKIVKYLPVNLMLRDEEGQIVVDSLGRPVSVEQSGLCDISGLVSEVSLAQMIEMHIAHLEKRSIILDKLSRVRGELVQVVLIKDFTHTDTVYPLKHPQLFSEFLRRVELMVTISRDFYPQTVGQAFIYKAPGAFGRIWKFFSSKMFKPHHMQLTQFVDSTFNGVFDLNLLPTELGGLNPAKLSQLPGRPT